MGHLTFLLVLFSKFYTIIYNFYNQENVIMLKYKYRKNEMNAVTKDKIIK